MSRYHRALAFYLQLEAEVTEDRDHLEPEHHSCLSRYYKSLKDHRRLRAFYRYNWARRVTPMLEIICSLPRRQVRWQILDAGCGTGTESIFWSTLREDVEVTGVDIRGDRLETARTRQAAYEDRLGRALNLRFLDQDVFCALEAGQYDLVWAMEAISHIDPMEEFLALVSERLRAGGHLVISDSHVLNPVIAWRVWQLRVSGAAERTVKASSTGEHISYAQERLFSAGQVSKMLKENGFRLVRVQHSVFFPPALARSRAALKIGMWADALLNRVPLARNLGAIYTIAATRAD